MIKIELGDHNVFEWGQYGDVYFRGYILNEMNEKLILKDVANLFADVSSVKGFTNILGSLNGCFSIIYECGDNLFMACDRVRTFPLFYRSNGEEVLITDYLPIEKYKSEGVDHRKIDQLRCGRYVLGDSTVFKGMKSVQAGEVVALNPSPQKLDFSDFLVTSVESRKTEDLSRSFRRVLDEVVDGLIASVDTGSRIVIPLSSGYDSRLIASLLKLRGFSNVLCFTYGNKESTDVAISKVVADRLGFDWLFVEPHKSSLDGACIYDKEFISYCEFASSGISLPVFQDFFIIKQMLEQRVLKKGDVLVPGHSGDMLVGNHLHKHDKAKKGKKYFVSSILKRHFILDYPKWEGSTMKEIERYYSSGYRMHSMIDNYNLRERQAKYIVNSLRVYEFFGFEHRMPLWHKSIFDFFKYLDFDRKFASQFYVDYIFENVFKGLDIAIVPPDKHVKVKSWMRMLKYILPYKMQYKARRRSRAITEIADSVEGAALYRQMLIDCEVSATNLNAVFANWLIDKFFIGS